jgi:hypothetical protein
MLAPSRLSWWSGAAAGQVARADPWSSHRRACTRRRVPDEAAADDSDSRPTIARADESHGNEPITRCQSRRAGASLRTRRPAAAKMTNGSGKACHKPCHELRNSEVPPAHLRAPQSTSDACSYARSPGIQRFVIKRFSVRF